MYSLAYALPRFESLPIGMSSNGWGSAPTTWAGLSPVGTSPISTWGTIQTHPPPSKLSNTPSTIPLTSYTTTHVNSPTWDPVSRSTSSTLFSPYVASGSGTSPASYCSVPAEPASPPSASINPCLRVNSQSRLAADFSAPIPVHGPSMGDPAFYPGLTYARVIIFGPKTWFFELAHSQNCLTVLSVLEQIYHFLQQVESPNDALASRMRSQVNVGPDTYRDQNHQRNNFGYGVKRIDLLGARCCLDGFEPAGEKNTWLLRFRSK